MSDVAIRVEGLGKRYRIGRRTAPYRSLRESLTNAAMAPWRRLRDGFHRTGRASGDDTIWALKDVDLEIRRGEVVGVIGRNGAGKSTLLKILSRITEPTEGRVELHGRVGSLLEVGTGFHLELTGRENIFLNGAILGMRRAEIQRKFDEIVAFAEIDKFLDTPVKHYSSGMYVRLAFAVAAHLEPEILLVDEVLAVGDAAFQKKCLGKMDEVASEGRTVLFVSHNMGAIQTLTTRALLMSSGSAIGLGSPSDIIRTYLSALATNTTEHRWNEGSAPGTDAVKLIACRLRPTANLTVKTPFLLEFDVENHIPGQVLNVSIHLNREGSGTVFNTFSPPKPLPEGAHRFSCFIPGNLLNDGIHSVDVFLVRDEGLVLFRKQDLLRFTIEDHRGDLAWFGAWPGAARPLLNWNTQEIVLPGDDAQPKDRGE